MCSGDVADKDIRLQTARDTTAELNTKLNGLLGWLEDQENYLKGCSPVSDTYDKLVEQLDEHKVPTCQILVL